MNETSQPLPGIASTAWKYLGLWAARMPLASASMGAMVVFAAGALVTYVCQVVMARLIGAASFGIYAYVLSWVTLLTNLSTLGFQVSLLKFLPAYRATEEWPKAKGLIHFAAATASTVSVAAGFGLMALSNLYGGSRTELGFTFLIGFAVVPLLTLQIVGAAAVRAFGSAVLALVPERLIRDGLSLAVIVCTVGTGVLSASASAAGLAMAVGAAGALCASVFLFLRRKPHELGAALATYDFRSWTLPTIPLLVFLAADVLLGRAGVMVLGLYGQHEEAGVFAAASSIALIAALPRMAVASNFAPLVSDLYARGELASLQRLSARAAGLSLLSTLAVVIPIFTALDDVIGLFGPNFRSGTAATAILLVAQLFASACGPHQHLLTMTRHEKTVAAIFAGGAGVTLLLAMALVPFSGGIGAAFAGAAGIVCMNVALLVAVKRKLDLAPGLLALISITIDPVRRAGRWEKKGIGT